MASSPRVVGRKEQWGHGKRPFAPGQRIQTIKTLLPWHGSFAQKTRPAGRKPGLPAHEKIVQSRRREHCAEARGTHGIEAEGEGRLGTAALGAGDLQAGGNVNLPGRAQGASQTTGNCRVPRSVGAWLHCNAHSCGGSRLRAEVLFRVKPNLNRAGFWLHAGKPYETRGGNQTPCVFSRSRLRFTLKAASRVGAV